MEVDSIEASYRRLLSKLEREFNFKLKQVIPINNNRYIIAQGDENILIVFKREFYLSFGREFKDLGESGIGESLNVQDIKEAIRNKVNNIYFIYQTGHIYTISLSEFLLKSHSRINKENKETRSLSIHHLTRFGDL